MITFINNKGNKAVAAACVPVALAALLSLAGALLTGCGAAGGEDEAGIKVAADIVPVADFCRRVGGGLVEVETLVPPGSNPHTFELTSGQMKYLSEADVLACVGLGLTPWAEDIFGRLENPGLVTVLAGESLPKDSLIVAEGGEGDAHGAYDPHVWLDPGLAAVMVESIRDGFIAADPGHAGDYVDNAAAYIEELRSLDAYIQGEVAGFTEKKFVSFHSSWVYFARRYGLEQVGVIEERPGKEPSAAEIAELVELVRSRGVRAVFAEPQFSPRAAEAIAEESGGVTVRIVDPVGDPQNPETDTYVKMMKRAVQIMGEALR